MSKSNLPLKIVISRVGEPTLAEYGISKIPVDSPQVSCQFWRTVIETQPGYEPEKEHLVAILLNTKLKPLGFHIVATGCLNECVSHPREIFRPAIILAAYAFILLHNHPSGDPTPSQADRRLTRQLSEASTLLQINMLDHVIVGGREGGQPPYFSFREAGCL